MRGRKEISAYIPLNYKKFISLDAKLMNESLAKMDDDENLISSECQPEIGISDAAQNNKSYDNLISHYGLDVISNSEIVEEILQKYEYFNNSNHTELIKEILNYSNNDEEIISYQEQQQSEEEVIALWRINKYSIKSISARTQIPKEIVNKILSKYRRLVKQQCNENKKKRSGKRFVVSPGHIMKIKDYLDYNEHRPICARDVIKAVWAPQDNECSPSDSTIYSILKKEFKMSYRLLEKKHMKSVDHLGTRKFIQAFSLQLKLSRDNIEIIYVDEFSFSSRK